jgi:FSR family fosmidomycin resistance protein-like MFS transporter
MTHNFQREPALEPAAVAPVAVAQSAGAAAGARLSRDKLPQLAALSVSHTMIDLYATCVAPVSLILAAHVGFSDARAMILVSLATFVASFAQPVFGYFSDRFGGRWLVIATPMIAGLCYGNLLAIDSLPLLLGTIAFGALAVAAFHPEGAALAGAIGKPNAALTTSIFIAAGPVGLAFGPKLITSVAYNNWPTWWIAIGGILCSVLLWFALPSGSIQRSRTRSGLDFLDAFQGRWSAVVKLVTISSTRAFVTIGFNAAIPVLWTARMSGDRAAALPTIGWWSTILLGCGAIGGVICSLTMRREWEKRVNVMTFAVAWPLLVVIPSLPGVWAWLALVVGGLALGATNPIVVTMGQRLAPRGAGLASALVLGFSWGIGGTIAPLLFTRWADRYGVETGMSIIAAFTALALLGSLLLKHEDLLDGTDEEAAA